MAEPGLPHSPDARSSAARVIILIGVLAVVAAGAWWVLRPRGLAGTQNGHVANGAPSPSAGAPASSPAAGAPEGVTPAAADGAPPEVSPNPGPDLTGPVAAVARQIGTDPAAILARVSRVRYEVYPGVFRGAGATISDNAGNDYDRAVLLHDLLVASNPGIAVRYAVLHAVFRAGRQGPGLRSRRVCGAKDWVDGGVAFGDRAFAETTEVSVARRGVLEGGRDAGEGADRRADRGLSEGGRGAGCAGYEQPVGDRGGPRLGRVPEPGRVGRS